MSDEAVVASKMPLSVEVAAGKTYYWCSCGRSKKQPFCDGAHKGTDFKPVAFTAERSEVVHLCGCKRTKDQPFCDGSHQEL